MRQVDYMWEYQDLIKWLLEKRHEALSKSFKSDSHNEEIKIYNEIYSHLNNSIKSRKRVLTEKCYYTSDFLIPATE